MSLARNDGPDGRGELTKTQTSSAERMSKTSARSRVQLKEEEGARFETIRSGSAEEASRETQRKRQVRRRSIVDCPSKPRSHEESAWWRREHDNQQWSACCLGVWDNFRNGYFTSAA
jgi:hypothetical protein